MPAWAFVFLTAVSTPASPRGASSPPPPRRGNTVLQGQGPGSRYGVAASLRVPVLVGEASALAAPPVGFGFGFQLRAHPWRVGRARLGFGLFAGHVRVPTVVEVGSVDDPQADPVRRQQLITHTDFAGGVSMHVPAGAIVFAFDLGAGAFVSTFSRPVDVRPELDEWVAGADPILRGGASLFVPVRDNHGPVIGVAGLQPFSGDRVEGPAGPTRPFTTVLDATVGYMAFF